jgi:hypothetical protein
MELQSVLLGALLIFFVRVLSITLATIRLLIMGRTSKALVAGIAFFEALTFALTFGVVASDLTNMWYLAAYCGGFAAGTWRPASTPRPSSRSRKRAASRGGIWGTGEVRRPSAHHQA